MARELLNKIHKDIEDDKIEDEEEDEFIKNLKADSNIEQDEIVANVLRRRALDVKGKLHHKVADKLDLSN